MSRRSPKWRRPTPKPQQRVSMPPKMVVEQDHAELVTLMKMVAEDVVMLSNALPAKHGAF